MTESGDIAGVILAGGRSARMGQNKALLTYHGVPLIDHMTALLKAAGVSSVLISGTVPGHAGVPDAAAFEGPGHAIAGMIRHLQGQYKKILFVPVDMPLLTPDLLMHLIVAENGGYFEDHFLPVCIANLKPDTAASAKAAVRAVLADLSVPALPLPDPYRPLMVNANTQEEWQALTARARS